MGERRRTCEREGAKDGEEGREREAEKLDIKEIENSSLVKEKPQIKLGLQSLAETKIQEN